MSVMQAKFSVHAVESFHNSANGDLVSQTLKFGAVCKGGGYPEDGSDENNTFARWTPSASCEMLVTNPDLFGAFSVGQEFYVNFVPADSGVKI